ncbi:MAG: hypothetical protein HZC48_05150 [Nitrospirae bacterium]|nr:hypothetical protein [Nitrospirota bacterium]
MKNIRFIYFAGVDGCGKSSVIDELITEYERNGIKARRVWLRFNYFITKPVLLFCRITGITRRVRKNNKIYSIHDFHKSRLIAFIVQYLHLVDTFFAYIIKVWLPLKFTNDIILCDKFVYDILADFMVETRDLNLLDKRIAKLFLKLIPNDIPVIFVSVDKDEIIRRKPEVLIDDEDYDLKYKIYQLIMQKYRVRSIINNNFNDTVSEIKKIIDI